MKILWTIVVALFFLFPPAAVLAWPYVKDLPNAAEVGGWLFLGCIAATLLLIAITAIFAVLAEWEWLDRQSPEFRRGHEYARRKYEKW